MTSEDERLRESHRKIANRVTKYGKGVYLYSDLPTNERGERIMCGQDYQCRCTADPLTYEELQEMKQEQKAKERR